MKSIINPARARLEAGEVSVGVGLRVTRPVDIAKAMKTAGYDWLFIDLEHSPISIDTAAQISVAALDSGITPLVRVPWMEHWVATRVLDGGALGIVMPHVDTADQAREEVLRRLSSQLDSEHVRWRDLGRRLDLYERTILSISSDNAVAALAAYQSDAGDFAEVMRAYLDDLNTRTDYIRLQVERAQSFAMLANLGGIPR